MEEKMERDLQYTKAQQSISTFKVWYSILKIIQMSIHYFLIQSNHHAFWYSFYFVEGYFTSLNIVGIIYSGIVLLLCWFFKKPFYLILAEFAFLSISVSISLLIFHWEIDPNYDATQEIAALEDKLNYMDTTVGPSPEIADPQVVWTDRILRKEVTKLTPQTLGNEFYFMVLAMFFIQWYTSYYVFCKYVDIETMTEMEGKHEKENVKKYSETMMEMEGKLGKESVKKYSETMTEMEGKHEKENVKEYSEMNEVL